MDYIRRHMEGLILELTQSYGAILLTGPRQAGKTTLPDRRITNAFRVIDKTPLHRGTGAVLCMARQVGAINQDNLIVPIWMI